MATQARFLTRWPSSAASILSSDAGEVMPRSHDTFVGTERLASQSLGRSLVRSVEEGKDAYMPGMYICRPHSTAQEVTFLTGVSTMPARDPQSDCASNQSQSAGATTMDQASVDSGGAARQGLRVLARPARAARHTGCLAAPSMRSRDPRQRQFSSMHGDDRKTGDKAGQYSIDRPHQIRDPDYDDYTICDGCAIVGKQPRRPQRQRRSYRTPALFGTAALAACSAIVRSADYQYIFGKRRPPWCTEDHSIGVPRCCSVTLSVCRGLSSKSDRKSLSAWRNMRPLVQENKRRRSRVEIPDQ